MELVSWQTPADEMGVPFFACGCATEDNPILLKVLNEMRAGFIRRKWKIGIRLHFNFDEHTSHATSDDNLPPFIIVNLNATIAPAHFHEMREFARRGVIVLGIMLRSDPVLLQTFNISEGRACIILPEDMTLHVDQMEAFFQEGIPTKS